MRKIVYFIVCFVMVYGKMTTASFIEEESFFTSPYKQVIRGGLRRSSVPSDYKQNQTLLSHSLRSEGDEEGIEIKPKTEKKSTLKKRCSSLPDGEIKNLKINELTSLLEEKEKEKIKKEYELVLGHLKEMDCLTQKLHSSEIENLLLKENIQLREKEIKDTFHKKEIDFLLMVSEKERVYLDEKNKSNELVSKKDIEFEIIKVQKKEELKREKEENSRLSILCNNLKEQVKEHEFQNYHHNKTCASLTAEITNQKVRYDAVCSLLGSEFNAMEKQYQGQISQKDTTLQKLKNDLAAQNLLVDNLKKQIPEIEKLKGQLALKDKNDVTNSNLQKALQTEKALLQNQITTLSSEKSRLQKDTNTLNTELTQLRQKISEYNGYERYSFTLVRDLKYVNNSHFATSSWLLKPEQRFAIANFVTLEQGGLFKIQKL